MKLSQILKRPMNTKDELQSLANKLGFDIHVQWLNEYDINKDYDIPTVLNIGNNIIGGTHFVAIYKNQYFDPFGIDAPKSITEKNNNLHQSHIDIQSIKTGHCGIYCVCFLYYAIHNDIDSFFKSFKNLNRSIL